MSLGGRGGIYDGNLGKPIFRPGEVAPGELSPSPEVNYPGQEGVPVWVTNQAACRSIEEHQVVISGEGSFPPSRLGFKKAREETGLVGGVEAKGARGGSERGGDDEDQLSGGEHVDVG